MVQRKRVFEIFEPIWPTGGVQQMAQKRCFGPKKVMSTQRPG